MQWYRLDRQVTRKSKSAMLIFDSEAIYNKAEGDGTGLVAKEAGSGSFDKVIRREKLDEADV